MESRHIALALHEFKTLQQVLDSTLAVDSISLQEVKHGCKTVLRNIDPFFITATRTLRLFILSLLDLDLVQVLLKMNGPTNTHL